MVSAPDTSYVDALRQYVDDIESAAVRAEVDDGRYFEITTLGLPLFSHRDLELDERSTLNLLKNLGEVEGVQGTSRVSLPTARKAAVQSTLNGARALLPLRRVEDNVLMGTVADTPQGMSGGPLWRHQDVVTESKLWLQSHACKIVGIQSAWNETKRQLYLEPSDRWYDWFISTVEQIDREMSAQG